MTRYTFGTALRAATLAAAIGALATPAFAQQQQPGTGGGAGGESGSSKATDMNKGPVNPTAGSTGAAPANTGMNQNTGGGASKAGTGGGAGGDSGSGSTSERQTGTPRGDPATPAK